MKQQGQAANIPRMVSNSYKSSIQHTLEKHNTVHGVDVDCVWDISLFTSDMFLPSYWKEKITRFSF